MTFDVVLHYNMETDGTDVFLFDRDESGRRQAFYTITSEGDLEVHRSPAAMCVPAIRLDGRISGLFLSVLAERAIKAGFYKPPTLPVAPTEDVRAHLADTQAVRDRLLTLVEKGPHDVG